MSEAVEPGTARVDVPPPTFSVLAFERFGGGLAAWVQRVVVVVERRWLGEQEYLSAWTICGILPGANQVNLAVFVGTPYRGGLRPKHELRLTRVEDAAAMSQVFVSRVKSTRESTMPVNLVAPYSKGDRRTNKPALLFAAQLIAIVLVAAAAISLECTANDSLAGSAQQEIAGP